MKYTKDNVIGVQFIYEHNRDNFIFTVEKDGVSWINKEGKREKTHWTNSQVAENFNRGDWTPLPENNYSIY